MADHPEDRLRALVAAADPVKRQYPGVYGKNVERLNVALRNNADALLDVVAAAREALRFMPSGSTRYDHVTLRDALARLDAGGES